MHLIRKIYRKSAVYWLLASSICLRSLIAPGFMLDTSADNPLDLRITICNGINGINSIDGLASMHQQHHDHHGMHDGGDDTNSHDHENDHFTAVCGLWSASGTFAYDFSPGNIHPPVIRKDKFPINYDSPLLGVVIHSRHLSRAPPFILT